MTTFFLDPEGGNDSNDGTTFANRWQTITSGATAARIGPGDVIRIIASQDPVSIGTVTWTDGSPNVTLAGALTTNIYLDGAWTATTNVTCSTQTVRKEGANCSQIAIAAGFTTGLAAYFATGTLDLSSKQQMSFWFKQSAGTLHSDASWLTLSLCSDTAGATPVASISIPPLGIVAANIWHVFTVDFGSALPAAVESIALYVNSDQGAQTFQIDNVIACNAPGAANALTLTSLISKDTGDGWWPIRSIDGTSVILEGDVSQSSGTAGNTGYQGASESVTGFARETVRTIPGTGVTSTVWGSVQDSGTSGSPITFSGGWNRTDMSTQTGETYLDGSNGYGYGIYSNNQSYITFEKVSFTRHGGLYLTGSSSGWDIDVANVAGMSANVAQSTNAIPPVDIRAASSTINIDAIVAHISSIASAGGDITTLTCSGALNSTMAFGLVAGVSVNGSGSADMQCIKFNTCPGSTFTLGDLLFNGMDYGSSGEVFSVMTLYQAKLDVVGNVVLPTLGTTTTNLFSGGVIDFSGSTGTLFGTTASFVGSVANFTGQSIGVNVNLDNSTTVGGTFTGAVTVSANSVMINPDLSSATLTAALTGNLNIQRYNATDDYRIVTYQGDITSETTVRHTASGFAWKFTTTASGNQVRSVSPLSTPIATFAVASGSLVTFKAWVRRATTDLSVGIRVSGLNTVGVAEAETLMTAAIDTWEEITLTFTPTSAGVVQVLGVAYYGAAVVSPSGSDVGYIDDLTISQA